MRSAGAAAAAPAASTAERRGSVLPPLRADVLRAAFRAPLRAPLRRVADFFDADLPRLAAFRAVFRDDDLREPALRAPLRALRAPLRAPPLRPVLLRPLFRVDLRALATISSSPARRHDAWPLPRHRSARRTA